MLPGIFESPIQFQVIDAGCRGGFKALYGLHECIHYIGFDPDPNSYQMESVFLSEKFLPFGLHHSAGLFDFYTCNHPSMSSMLAFDEDQFLKHFGLMNNSGEWFDQLRIKSKTTIPAKSLDEIFKSEGLPCIDFLKLDTQGTELSILHGAETILKLHKIGIIKCEVAFIPVYKNQALFYEIAEYLNGFGYKLANLSVYPDAVFQRGQPKIKFNSFKEKIRFASGGDALFYLDTNENDKALLFKQGLMLASEQIYSLAFRLLIAGGKSNKETLELFAFFKKQKKKRNIRSVVQKINSKLRI